MKRLLTVFFVLLASAAGWASDEVTVPEPLAPWQGWVMDGEAQVACPGLNGENDRVLCLWPGTLHLVADQAQGRFRQKVTLFADGFVGLPGDTTLRPHTVTADGASIPVTLADGRPRVYLGAGTHSLSGRFSWTRRPHAISVPPATASVALTVDGGVVEAPYLDGDHRLWMNRPRQTPRENDQLSVEAARLFADVLPATVTTRLTLSVSGGKRRETLEGILLADTSPVSLSSDLPARMGEDGSLEVDVKPGKWTVTVTAVYDDILSTLAPFEAPFGPEVWVFRRSSSMRLVSLEGLKQVDPHMTRLPEAWKRFPAYLAKKDDVLGVTEVRRGQGKGASRLTLDREVWLDFDGGGATVRDRISGELNARRFVSLPDGPFQPGRIRLDGRDRMVADSGRDRFGVEVQKGAVALDAVSRMGRDTSPMALPVGWNLAFDRTSMVVHLPVGWGILAVAGAAVESGRVFLDAWSLLDFFLILVVGVAAFKLWGPIWGCLFVPGLALVWQEPFSPGLLWPAVLVTTALMRLAVQGDGRLAGLWGRGVRGLHGAVLVSLVAVSLVFASQQLRQALYPQLELRHGGTYRGAGMETDGAARPMESAMESMMQMDEVVSRSSLAKTEKRARPRMVLPPDEGETQTGPALPAWRWMRVAAVTGPAAESHSVTLHLVPPSLRRGLHVVRVAVLLLLLLRVAPVPPGGFFRRQGAQALLLLGVCLCLLPRGASADAFPPAPLLDELRSRLTEPPPCAPFCSALSRAELTLPQKESDPARLVLQVDAQAHVAVPLPSGDGSWRIASVADKRGRKRELLKVDGETWVRVTPGIHTVVLNAEGGGGEWTFRFPLAPGTVRVKGTKGWQVSGLTDTLQVDGVIRVTRMAADGDTGKPLTGKGRLFSWFRVQRRMEFGLEWRVVTTVTRNGGDLSGPPVVMSLDLLAGEEIRTDLKGVKRTGDSVSVTFPSGVTRRRWESVLPPGTPLALKAPDSGRVVEAWTLHLDPIWHLAWKGIAPTGGTDRKGMVWLPRRGETVNLSVSRFAGAVGRTLTVDRARVTLRPGRGETRMELEAGIRASKGAEVAVTSRFNPNVKEVTVSGEPVPVPEEGGALTVPVDPGESEVRVSWRASDTKGFSLFSLLVPRKTAMPDLSLGRSTSNIDLIMHLSRDRWILWTQGPVLGPAVLMWSIVALVILAGALLGRVPFSPLSGTEWALLGLGLVTRSLPAVVMAAGWFFALEVRRRKRPSKRLVFNGMQLGLVAWGVLVVLVLFEAVRAGLLGIPDMQVSGNGSTAILLRWTVDRVAGAFPEPAVWTLPVWSFRLVMLAWSLWLALKVVGWGRWAAGSLGEGGFWMSRPEKKKDPEAPAAHAEHPES